MPIVKGGFTHGAHGRKAPASFGRRVMYLSADHDRDKAVLLDAQGKEISRGEALDRFGGKDAVYFEVIYAPSVLECRALEERLGGPESAQQELSRQLAGRLSPDRPCLAAVHTHGDRWHLHLPIQGEAPPRLLGPNGEAQRVWDEVWRATRPQERILDWEAHQRFVALRAELKVIQKEHRNLDRERYEAIREERTSEGKWELARRYEVRALLLVQRRYQLELTSLQARYEARGRAGGLEHGVEKEQADARRSLGENRIQRRSEQCRERYTQQPGLDRGKGLARRTDRTLGEGRERLLRATERTVALAGRAATQTVDLALREAGVSPEVRQAARVGMAMTQAGVSLGLKTAQVATRAAWELGREVVHAAGRQAIHASKVTAQMGVGVVLALPTGGQSLVAASRESAAELGVAGKDLVQNGAKVGQVAVRETGKAATDLAQEGLRSARSLGLEALPLPVREAARAALEVGKTMVRVATDVVRLDPLGAATSLGKGGMEIALSGAKVVGMAGKLPEVVRLPLQALEKVPVVGLAATAARITGEVAIQVVRGPELGLGK